MYILFNPMCAARENFDSTPTSCPMASGIFQPKTTCVTVWEFVAQKRNIIAGHTGAPVNFIQCLHLHQGLILIASWRTE